jgi:hypothetical protein
MVHSIGQRHQIAAADLVERFQGIADHYINRSQEQQCKRKQDRVKEYALEDDA